MTTHWIVVADASRARVLSAAKEHGGLRVVHELDYPSARKRSQEIVSDEPGRLDKGGLGVLSAMDPRTDPHDQQASQFAHQLADLLDKAAGAPAYTRLTILAPPRFLGLMRSSLSVAARNAVVRWLPRDLTRLELSELPKRLRSLGVLTASGSAVHCESA